MVLLAGWLPFALLVGVVWYLRRRKP